MRSRSQPAPGTLVELDGSESLISSQLCRSLLHPQVSFDAVRPSLVLADAFASFRHLSLASAAWRHTVVVLGAVFIGIPGVYYSYVEIVRNAEVRRRRKRWTVKAEERRRRRMIEQTASRDAIEGKGKNRETLFEGDENQLQGVDEEEMDEIKRAYGSFVVGGRWSNALGSEWREQGA